MGRVRKAELGDAVPLSLLAEKTFRDTFGAVNTAEDMALHCQHSYSPAIQAGEIAEPDRLTLLAEVEGRLVGYAQLRWGRSPACVGSENAGEIQRLYVIDDYHGKGIAQDLMTASLEEMRARKVDTVWLGVWENNPKAMAFYRKYGFTEVGDHVFPLGQDPQRDVILSRRMVGA